MKTEPVVGERCYFRRKRYRVVATEMLDCVGCDARFDGDLCGNVVCQASRRTDGCNIQLKLQPKYRKEYVK